MTDIYKEVKNQKENEEDEVSEGEEKDQVGELGDEHSEIKKAMLRPVTEAETDRKIDGYYEMDDQEKLETLLDRTEDLFQKCLKFEEKAAEINSRFKEEEEEEEKLSQLSEEADEDSKTVYSQMTESTNPDVYLGTEIDMTRSGQLKMNKALFVKQTGVH